MKFNNPGRCLRCGQCCKALYVQISREQIIKRARDDEARGMSILESDALFLMRFGILLTPEEARFRSPAIVDSPEWPRAEYWTCRFHREDDLCYLDILGLPKPHICTGYPWYNKEPCMKWMYPGCGYQVDLLGKRIKGVNKPMPINPEEIEVNVSEVVNYSKITGTFDRDLIEVVKRKVAAEEAKKKGILVEADEIQRAADIFRSVNNLLSAEDTETWLREKGLTLDTLEDYLETNLLIFKLKQELMKETTVDKYYSSPIIKETIEELVYAEWLAQQIR